MDMSLWPPDRLGSNASVLISFVAPASGQKKLTLRLKHSGRGDGPLEVTLGSYVYQLDPPSKTSLTIDDITLHPIQVPIHLSFEPEIRNIIVIRFKAPAAGRHSSFLHDIELRDEYGLWGIREMVGHIRFLYP